jgi:D-aspartate ligase
MCPAPDRTGASSVIQTVPVVLFRAEGYASLGVVRSLGRLGVPVYCIDHDPKCLAARSRYCAGLFTWDFEENSEQDSVQFLAELARRLGAKPVLLPAGDAKSLFVERYAQELAKHYLLPGSRPGAAANLHNKRSLHDLARSAGVPAPDTHFPGSPEELRNLLPKLCFPLVLKPVASAYVTRWTERTVALVRSPADLLGAYERFASSDSPEIAIQEWIPHVPEDRGFVSAYFDGQGNCLFALTGRKLRQLPIDGGVTTFAVCSPCSPMLDHACRIAREAGYAGVIDLDFCRDPRDSRWKLLDANPRFGANFRALVDRRGLDAVRALYLDLTGQAVPVAEPPSGRYWLVEDKDLWALREHMREHSLKPADWARSVMRTTEFAYWSAGDPRPSLSFMARFTIGNIRTVVRRTMRR